MSRLAGILSSDSAFATQNVDRMVAVSRQDHAWQSRFAADNRVVFGWCGWADPQVGSHGGLIVAIDGRFYNADEYGSTVSNPALVIDLYSRHGFAGALSRLNGEFSIALFDPRTNTLWLGRDRLGIKPLYYVERVKFFAFASRPYALLTVSGVSTDVNREFVGLFAGSHYRHFDNRPEKSPYSDISQLQAGHVLRVRDGQLTTMRYWRIEELPDLEVPERELADQYRVLLSDAVRVRVSNATRPAFTLSGGMDSSSVLGCAVRALGEKQAAFSTVYGDKTFDESEEIRSMLDSSVAQWNPIRIEPTDLFSIVKRMIEAHEEPVATATWLSHFLLCEEVQREGFQSLFGGLGGDELNAGEYEHFWYFFADLRVAGREDLLDREVRGWTRYHDHPIYRKNHAIMEEKLPMLADLSQPGRCLPDRQRMTRYASALNPEYFDLNSFEPPAPHAFQSYLKNRSYQDLTLETTPCCLRAEDRHSAAFGIDHFLPFLDYRVVEFMFRVPGTMKFRDGVSKRLLREAMRGILPEETRTRVKKVGWNAPAHVWFSGSSRDALRDMVHSQSFQERGIYRIDAVERIIVEHDNIVSTGAQIDNHMMFLWQLVNLELWLLWLDQSVSTRYRSKALRETSVTANHEC